jgi:hypothetical protein
MTTLISGTCYCGNKIRGSKNYCVKCRKAIEHRHGETDLDYRIRTGAILGRSPGEIQSAVREKAYYASMWNDPELQRLEQEKDRAFKAKHYAEAYHRDELPAADAEVTRAIRRFHEYVDAGAAKARRG